MDLVSVTITAQAITSRYGTLMPGDLLRTDAAYAKHLVEECGAARFNVPPAADDAPVKKTRASRKPAEPTPEPAAEPAEPAADEPAPPAPDTPAAE